MAVLALNPVSPGHRECPVPGFRLMLCVLPASGAGTGVRDTGTPVLVDTPEAPQAGTAKNECLLPSHGCSQPALLLTLPRPGSEPVRQESPHPRTSVSCQPGKRRPCSSPPGRGCPGLSQPAVLPLAGQWNPATSFNLKQLPLAKRVKTTVPDKRCLSIFLKSLFIY